jgi:TPR repeat protein
MESTEYYRMAADPRRALRQYNYDVCLDKGTGIPWDPEKAAECYKLAADQEHPDAQ